MDILIMVVICLCVLVCVILFLEKLGLIKFEDFISGIAGKGDSNSKETSGGAEMISLSQTEALEIMELLEAIASINERY